MLLSMRYSLTVAFLFFCTTSANASKLDARRAEILKEVRETIPDDEMAKQIVEIRLKREAQEITDPKKSTFSKQDAYVSAGSRIAIGYSQKISENLAVRTEVSGLDSSVQTKSVNNTNYRFKDKNLSLGAYLDWFPTDSSFRLSGGVNINRMRTTLNINEEIHNPYCAWYYFRVWWRWKLCSHTIPFSRGI